MKLRELTSETRQRVHRLYDTGIGWREYVRTTPETISLLTAIGESGEPAAIPDIIPFLLDADNLVAESAATAIHALLDGMLVSLYSTLDERARRSAYWCRRVASWSDLKPAEVAVLHRFGDRDTAVLGMVSFHPNGYVRQEAVRALASRWEGAEWPFLLLRLNDWVYDVSREARKALEERLRLDCAAHFVRCLPLVLRLEQCVRWNMTEFVDAVKVVLAEPTGREALRQGMRSADRTVRRACLKVAAKIDGGDVTVFRIALKDPDPMLALPAARLLLARTDTDLAALLPEMLSAHTPALRREALAACAARLPETAPGLLRPALLDASAAVRETAREGLARFEQVDYADYYRAAVDAPPAGRLVTALAGLGETGSTIDAPRATRFLQDPSTKIRRAAVRTLARLDGDHQIEAFVLALADERGSVSREAREALRPRASQLGAARLWDMFATSHLPHTRRNSLLLLPHAGKWTALPYLLRACCDTDAIVADEARRFVQWWLQRYNRTFTTPSAAQLDAVRWALDETDTGLSVSAIEQLRFIFRTWRERL